MLPARASHVFSASRLSLQFGDAELEHAFRAEHWRQTTGGRRVGLLLGALMYAGFGLLDASIIPDVAHTAWLIRFGVVCPALLASLAMSFHSRISRRTTMLGGGLSVMAVYGMTA